MRFLLLFFFIFSCSFQLSDRFRHASKGDYIVTKQDQTFSLLLIKNLSTDFLLLEEICVPVHLRPNTTWKDWLESGAPGHTSWSMYEIETSSWSLVEAFCFSKKSWMYLDDSNQLITKLLSLPLYGVPLDQRKKIGPAPHKGELDHRKTWTPPVYIEGTKIKTTCEVMQTTWPKDHTLLSECDLVLYFPPEQISSFPIWIEANNGHFRYSITIVDSGKEITSPLQKQIPHRPPQILSSEYLENQIDLSVRASPYYKQFTLYAFDLLSPEKKLGPLPFTLSKKQDLLIFSLRKENLSSYLESGKRYKWLLLPQSPEGFAIESDSFFQWNK